MKTKHRAVPDTQQLVITAHGIAFDVGCSVQTVRKRMQEQSTRSTGVQQLQIGRNIVYYTKDMPLIRSLLCDDSLARGRADRTKKEMRERHQTAYRLRIEEGMSFAKIAAQLDYQTEGGALRAVAIEARRLEKSETRATKGAVTESVFSLAL